MSGSGLSLRSKSRRRLRAPYNPQIEGATPQIFNAAATSVAMVLPARNLNDRLIAGIVRKSSDADLIAAPSGWNALNTSGFSGAASCFCRAYYVDVTAGNLADTLATFTGGSSAVSLTLIWRLSGCDLSVAPVANGTVQNSNGVTTVDPASLTGPNGGATQRNIFLSYLGTAGQDSANGATPVVSTWPTGYGNTGTSTTTQVSAGNGCGQGWCSKVAVAGSDNPSAYIYGLTAGGFRAFTFTVAVRGVQE